VLALLPQQLVVHGELADLGLEAGHQLIPVVGRSALMAAVPPSRKAARQAERVEAMTPSSRERVSRSSPRSRRRTASVFRLAEKRPRSSVPVLVLGWLIWGTPSRAIMAQGNVQRKPPAKDSLPS
jgi:hypothetical protein